MTSRMVTAASRALERRTDRRGFLARSAIVGSALATVPGRYILRPGTAEAAICTCSGQSCDCGALCCDGYTEFCCTITGVNRCPAGTLAAGWWKADGSGFCDVNGSPQPRYYLDCNAGCGGCSCGSSGLCSGSCSGTHCGCVGGSCSNRKGGCTLFRYGQCNQAVPCVGPIVCRVVTCTPPWELDSSCTKTVLTDNATRFHNRSCLQAPVHQASAPAVWRAGVWHLRRSLSSGGADLSFGYGISSDIPVMGDWNGDGTKTVGVFRDGYWYLRNSNTPGSGEIAFKFGVAGDVPIVGDWTGAGRDLPGVVRDGRTWHLRYALYGGPADYSFAYGVAGDVPVVGNWSGSGRTGIGVVRGGRSWYLRQTPSGGPAQISLAFGVAGDVPVVGDWNADGRDSVGVVRGNAWYLRDALTSGAATKSFGYGTATDTFLTWVP